MSNPTTEGTISPAPLESLILARYSERTFTGEPIPTGIIEGIVGAAIHAPSPSGRNPFFFTIVPDMGVIRDLTDELAKGFQDLRASLPEDEPRKTIDYYERYTLFIRDASALVLCYTNDRKSGLAPFVDDSESEAANLLSLGAVLQNIGLLCTASSIGHCILSAPVELFPKVFERCFPAPAHLSLRCIVAMGPPSSQGREKPRPVQLKRHIKVVDR
ncbi:MAG: nitroreductase family protein [Acidobacteriota bacterium]